MKKIFITGGAGFISNLVIRRYIEDNFITVYDNFRRDSLTGSGLDSHPNLTVIRGDVLDYRRLEQSMEGSEIVIHAAAIAGIDNVLKDPIKTMRVNVIGTANALSAASFNEVSDRFVNFSTSEVFGSYAFKCKEDDIAKSETAGHARWTYSVSKLASEHLAHAYFPKLPIVTVRPFNIYGPGQTGEGAINNFIRLALKNEDIYINGDGSQIRAWCYVDDFVSCLEACIWNKKALGQIFNIGNPRAVITVLGLAQTICRVLNSRSRILFREALSADIELRVPDTQKTSKVLGVNATIDLEEGIIKTADWIKGTWI